jgi:hypothetical protein
MSRFQPVHLPADRRLNGKVRQTVLRHYAACPRSGYLSLLYDGEATTRPMIRGTAVHAIHERMVKLAVEQGEPFVPPEIVKAIADEVLAELPVPVEEHDGIREMAYRLAAETAVDPAAVIACETLLVMQIGGYEVRGRVDFAELLEGGAAVRVVDVKSSRSAPTWEEVSRKRPDGTRAGKAMQLLLYALLLAYGVPVRVVDGEEIAEPFPLAGRAQRFQLEFVYPAIEDREGLMFRRSVTLTRLELEEYRASFDGLLARLAHSEETGDWPAVVSDEACSECPAPSMCPIPAELRDHRGTINSHEQAAEALEVLDRRKAVDAAIRREVKAFAKHNGPVRWGADRVSEFVSTFAEEIKDREGLWAAIQRAAEFGEPFDRSVWVREKHGTSFRDRTLSADELAEEAIEEGDRA